MWTGCLAKRCVISSPGISRNLPGSSSRLRNSRQRLEAHLLLARPRSRRSTHAGPKRAMYFCRAFLRSRWPADVDPALALGEDVVVGQGEEVVAVPLVPVGDHFGEVVAVAPEGVGVQVALPVRRGGRDRSGDGFDLRGLGLAPPRGRRRRTRRPWSGRRPVGSQATVHGRLPPVTPATPRSSTPRPFPDPAPGGPASRVRPRSVEPVRRSPPAPREPGSTPPADAGSSPSQRRISRWSPWADKSFEAVDLRARPRRRGRGCGSCGPPLQVAGHGCPRPGSRAAGRSCAVRRVDGPGDAARARRSPSRCPRR